MYLHATFIMSLYNTMGISFNMSIYTFSILQSMSYVFAKYIFAHNLYTKFK